jgi:hypothetical protein
MRPPRHGQGSASFAEGRWQAHLDQTPNLRGAVTIERDLPAGTRLWLSGWTKTVIGGEFGSFALEIAGKGGRARSAAMKLGRRASAAKVKPNALCTARRSRD